MPRKSAMSKTQGGIIGLLVVVLFAICGIFYSLTGIDVGEVLSGSPTPSLVVASTLPPALEITETPFQPDSLFPTNTPVVLEQPTVTLDEPTVVPPAPSWWQVYFTDPLNDQ